jgi:hypothetical protein
MKERGSMTADCTESIGNFGGFGKDIVKITREQSAEPPIQVESSHRYADTLGSRGVGVSMASNLEKSRTIQHYGNELLPNESIHSDSGPLGL